tara:strand:+ start:772 stop:999 length:228 start_codon:yes stop_codon:yes gene_type:complete
MEIKGNKVIPHTQRMYKVGYGPNLWGIISEDSLERYTYLEGALELIGERTIYYLDGEDNDDQKNERFSDTPRTEK